MADGTDSEANELVAATDALSLQSSDENNTRGLALKRLQVNQEL
jgi:hypothetical protein